MLPDFAASRHGSVGVEFEATIIDSATSLPLPLAPTVAEAALSQLERGRVTPDLFQPIVEFTTGICSSMDDVRADLRAMWRASRPVLRESNAELLAMGLHPLAGESDMPVIADDRYRDIVNRTQWSGRRLHTTGIHVHIGMENGDAALRTAGALRPLLPLLMALAASSPYHAGSLTGLASTRVLLFDAVPRSGPMPRFDSWNDFVRFHDALHRADALVTPRDYWWDCRPQAAFGTLELRVMDSIADLDDIVALCSLAWCMGVGARHLAEFELPDLLSDENRWRAIRYGTSCEFLVDDHGTTEPVSQILERVVNALDATAEDLGCRDELERCLRLGRGQGSHQRFARFADADRNHIADALLHMRVEW